MPIPGNLLTTAMAVMPHTDVDQALKTALSMDIPFCPSCAANQMPLGCHQKRVVEFGGGDAP